MPSVRANLDLYRRLIGVQIRSQLAYRASFLLDVLAVGVGNLAEFASLALVLQRFEGIGGWTLSEVAFLYGMVGAAFGTMDLVFSGFDPGSFGERVRRGTFDQMLLRPVDITLQVLCSSFLLRRLGRITQGLAILAIALVDIRWTVLKVFYLPFVLVGLILFFGAFFVIGSTITFWTIESIEAINIFTYGGSEMISYPMNIYPRGLRRFFTYVVPAILMNYYPALYMLDKPDPFGLPAWAPFVAPLVGGGAMVLALLFWQFGIRHYKSTGT
jgi:ABC-2 type transport system permease protein